MPSSLPALYRRGACGRGGRPRTVAPPALKDAIMPRVSHARNGRMRMRGMVGYFCPIAQHIYIQHI